MDPAQSSRVMMENRIENKFARLQMEVVEGPRFSGLPQDMTGLVQDLHSALEESTWQGAGDDPGDSPPATGAPRNSSGSHAVAQSRRKSWRRRCKSTSNLSQIGAISSARHGPPSEGTSSSSDEDVAPGGLSGPHAQSQAGTSILLSDSDEMGPPRFLSARTRDPTLRKKRPTSDPNASTSVMSSQIAQRLPMESDSVNEKVALVRPNTKRKRKFKRMALDPNPTVEQLSQTKPPGRASPNVGSAEDVSTKRQKVKSEPGLTSVKSKGSLGMSSLFVGPFSVGKRKRGNREKSLEPEHLVQTMEGTEGPSQRAPLASSAENMDCGGDEDERQSSSSLSSSEWDDDVQTEFGDTGREADDEQSDWPGSESSFMRSRRSRANVKNMLNLTDQEEEEDDDPESLHSSLDAFFSMRDEIGDKIPLTDTARQAYMARMKRLAECVPGREIRAGTRKVRNRQPGFTIKSSSSEQLSRFLQDPNRSELKLSISRSADRSKVIQMANLYSLSFRFEGDNVIILSKTGRTVRLKEFPPPLPPPAESTEFKRRRRTPPTSPLLEGSSTSNEVPTSPQQCDVAMSPVLNVPNTPTKVITPFLQRSESPILGSSLHLYGKAKNKFAGSLSN